MHENPFRIYICNCWVLLTCNYKCYIITDLLFLNSTIVWTLIKVLITKQSGLYSWYITNQLPCFHTVDAVRTPSFDFALVWFLSSCAPCPSSSTVCIVLIWMRCVVLCSFSHLYFVVLMFTCVLIPGTYCFCVALVHSALSFFPMSDVPLFSSSLSICILGFYYWIYTYVLCRFLVSLLHVIRFQYY